MKKITIIILSFLLIFYSNTFVFASNTNEIHTLEVFEDGSYIEEQIDCSPTVSLFSTTSTKYGHKTPPIKAVPVIQFGQLLSLVFSLTMENLLNVQNLQ